MLRKRHATPNRNLGRPLLTVSILTSAVVWAQPQPPVTSSDEWIDHIAEVMSADSGYPKENFQEYAGKLASGLERMRPAQQARIFGLGGSGGSNSGGGDDGDDGFDDGLDGGDDGLDGGDDGLDDGGDDGVTP